MPADRLATPVEPGVAAATTESPWRKGLAAARANLWPGLALLAFAVTLLVCYDRVAPVQATLDAVGRLKDAMGFWFAVLSTPLFAGGIPALIERVLRPADADVPRGHFLARLAFWSFAGVQVDVLYRLQGYAFGDGRDWVTLAVKTAVDQFIWVPLWATPSTVAFFAWNDRRYGRSRYGLRDVFRSGHAFRRWYRQKVVPTVLANNAVWTPSVVIIYSLPPALQLVVMNLILCFWSLMLTLLTRSVSE